MIARAARFLGRNVEGVHAAAYILGISALGSSFLALLRDRLFAHHFGAGQTLDLYFAAFRIPDLIFVLVASLVSAYALIPALERRSASERSPYIETLTIGFGVLMIAISVVAFILMPVLLRVLFPELMVRAGEVLVLLARILLLQPIFLGFSNMLASITQMRRRYIIYASAPLIYNAAIIGGLLLLYPRWGLPGLAWGVVCGSILHAFIQFPGAVKGGYFTRLPRWGGVSPLWETIKLSLPRTLALGATQLVQLALLGIAGILAPGSIAVFMLAFNLQSVPLATIGASYSVAAFPTLARMAAEGRSTLFIDQVVTASRHILFWSAPAIALMIILRAHLVRAVLGSGQFDWTDTRLTAAAFAFFAVALAAQALSLLIIRAYYAAGRSYVPLAVSGICGIGSVMLAALLVSSYGEGLARFFLESLLRVEDVPGTIVLILPFCFSLGAIAGAVAFAVCFERDFGGFFAGVARVFWESLTAGMVAATAAYAVLAVLGGIGPATTLSAVFLHGMSAGLVGVAGSAMVYWFFGSPELSEAFHAFALPRSATPVQSTEETIT